MSKPLINPNRSFVHLILIAIIGLLAYSNTFHVPFQWDDKYLIAENPVIKDLNYFFKPSEAKGLGEYYSAFKSRYISYLSFALNYKIHGTDVTGYHIFNLSIHILNAMFVYLLAILTFKTPFLLESSLKEHSKKIALFSALLFVSHPVQTEAVTYVFQRLASLVAFFYLISLIAFISSRLSAGKAPRYTLYALSLISAVLAMKTKENAFTLPLVITLYEFFFFRGTSDTFKIRISHLIPLLLTLLIIPLTLTGIDKPAGEIIGGLGSATRGFSGISQGDYLFTQFRVIVTYIRLLFLPINQNIDYDYRLFDSFFNAQVSLSFLFLLSILSTSFYLFYRSRITKEFRVISFGIFWFFITLSVESSIIPIPMLINEYRIYLPGAGIFIAFSSASVYALCRLNEKRLPVNYLILLLAVIISLTISTYKRNLVWKDEITLWSDTLRKSPLKVRPYNNLGVAYANKGEFLSAIKYYRQALLLDPKSIETYVNLGNAYSNEGHPDAAVRMYKTAIKIDPNLPGIYYNLGVIHERKGDFHKAIEQYKKALTLDPAYEYPLMRIKELLPLTENSKNRAYQR